MNVSFQPNGMWFVFVEDTGETIAKDLPSKNTALIALHEQRMKNERG